jgi:tripartite-type tricarboxylate transporter receptor subunit TctC
MLRRRSALGILGATMVALTGTAMAQSYPTAPVKLIVPYGAGGASDTMARYLAQRLGERLGQPVVVENMPGAAGSIAYVAVSKSPPDGYTIGYMTSSLAINPVIRAKVGYDPVRSFVPITSFVEIQNVLIVPAASPSRTVSDLVATARKYPGKLNYVSLGPGSTPHLSAEQFLAAAGAKAQAVPYKQTTQAYTDLVEGRVDFWIASMPSTLPHVRAGKARALAVAGPKRSPAYPDVPTLTESGIKASSTFWQGLFAPAGTPQAAIDRINAAVHQVVAEPKTQAFFDKLGAELGAGTPDELAKVLRDEMEQWSRIAKEIGLRIM